MRMSGMDRPASTTDLSLADFVDDLMEENEVCQATAAQSTSEASAKLYSELQETRQQLVDKNGAINSLTKANSQLTLVINQKQKTDKRVAEENKTLTAKSTISQMEIEQLQSKVASLEAELLDTKLAATVSGWEDLTTAKMTNRFLKGDDQLLVMSVSSPTHVL